MQLHPLKLVTIVGESVIMEDIAKEAVILGASGYSLIDVTGQGSRSARNVLVVSSGSKTVKAEFVVPIDIAEKILEHISHDYFEHYACIAWLSDVQVLRGERYIAK